LSTIPPTSTKRTITSNLNSLNTKKDYTYDIGNHGYVLERHIHVVGLNRSTESLTRLGNWISNGNTDIDKKKIETADSLPLKNTTHYRKNE